MAPRNPALGADGKDYSNESYDRRVAEWRARTLYADPPVEHLGPIPQFPPEPKAAPTPRRTKRQPPPVTPPPDLFRG